MTMSLSASCDLTQFGIALAVGGSQGVDRRSRLFSIASSCLIRSISLGRDATKACRLTITFSTGRMTDCGKPRWCCVNGLAQLKGRQFWSMHKSRNSARASKGRWTRAQPLNVRIAIHCYFLAPVSLAGNDRRGRPKGGASETTPDDGRGAPTKTPLR
jgi:hypothetical protein